MKSKQQVIMLAFPELPLDDLTQFGMDVGAVLEAQYPDVMWIFLNKNIEAINFFDFKNFIYDLYHKLEDIK